MKKEFEVVEVSPSGKSGWSGGAWCLVWVFSTEGNFLLKGFIKECEKYIEQKGWKCWAIFNLYHTKTVPFYKKDKKGENFRTIIKVYKCDFEISEPTISRRNKSSKDFKYKIYKKGNWKNAILVKRLPQQFVNFNPPSIDELPGSLGSNDALKALKDKMDQKK
jgi:hypothetical protein